MNRKILCVDDDQNILLAYERQLRKQFEIKTALSGNEGLMFIDEEGPFAVIVADMRMPRMDGIQFLKNARQKNPDTVRMMLTGNADLETAIHAVNEGSIFRFLIKPCPHEMLAKSLEAGIEQYRLIRTEKDLLRDTLTGSIKILVEILSLVNPNAFSRTLRVRRYVKEMVDLMNISDAWQYEVAGMLCQIGCVTLPSDLLDKVYSNVVLNDDEKRLFSTHPVIARNLIANIPRLENVAKMIEGQQRSYHTYENTEMEGEYECVNIGAQLLKIAIDFEQLVHGGYSLKSAISTLKERQSVYNPKFLEQLAKIRIEPIEEHVSFVRVNELRYGMVAHQDIKGKNGVLVVAKGQEITYPVMAKLQNFAVRVGIGEPFRVIIQSNLNT